MADLKRIVYAEDEPDIQTVAKMALEMLGDFEVTLFDCGEDAVAGAEAAKPQLVLLDVMMPKMDGPTTLQHLRQIDYFKNVPIVFMTAKAQPREIEQLKALGAVDVIAKPFDPMSLVGQLNAIWEAHCARLS